MSGLSRQLGLWSLILYGIGDILGAGIYALVGKVAQEAGTSAWISFLVAAVLAGVTGLAYAELASRIPKSAGAAAFCGSAFSHPLVPHMVGFFVLASGITSTATVSLAVYGYLKVFLDVPQLAAATALIAGISLISFWGIRESAGANNILTAVEVSGLMLVIVMGLGYAAGKPAAVLMSSLVPDHGPAAILAGATIAFYAFIGFEDLANLAEEAKDPTRDIPRAILVAVAVSTVIYLTVVLIVLWAMTPEAAAKSERPLLEVLKIAGFTLPDWTFAPIALFSVSNTGMANLVMASRLLYGMADQGLLHPALARIHPVRRTPHVAVVLAMVLCLALVYTAGPSGIKVVAQTTSLLLILVFFMVHVSLIRLRARDSGAEDILRVPGWVPYAGIAVSLLVASQAPRQAYLRTLVVAAVALAVYWLIPKRRAA